ncbi:MAG: YcxB family protein [Alphaproteobacteria bacterium]
MHNWRQPESVLRFGDDISIEEGKTSMKFEFSQITKTRNLKRSFVLMIGSKMGLILSKDGFTIGNLGQFKTFIHEKTGK